jgi:hypothetical protein
VARVREEEGHSAIARRRSPSDEALETGQTYLARVDKSEWRLHQPEEEEAKHRARIRAARLGEVILEVAEARPNGDEHELDARSSLICVDREPEPCDDHATVQAGRGLAERRGGEESQGGSARNDGEFGEVPAVCATSGDGKWCVKPSSDNTVAGDEAERDGWGQRAILGDSAVQPRAVFRGRVGP